MKHNSKAQPPRVVTLNTEYLSKALKDARKDKPLREYAKEIGIGFTTLSRIENGHNMDLLTYVSLCDALGFQLEAFIIRWKVTQ